MSFSYKAAITVNHTKCGSSDSTDFPILISGTYAGAGGLPDLRSVGNGGKVQNSNGYDIYFYSDSALTTRIPAERVFYNASTGVIEVHSKKSVSHTVDIVIYIAYGDSGISTDPNLDATYGATSVWDINYIGVYHLPDGTTLSANDSTSNANNLSITNVTATTGQIDGGGAFSGTTPYLSKTNNSTLNFTTPGVTMEAWINPTNNGTYMTILAKGTPARTYTYFTTPPVGGVITSIFVDCWGAGAPGAVAISPSISYGVWTHVAVTAPFSGFGTPVTATVYVNGVSAGTGSLTPASTNNTSLYIGAENTNGFPFAGSMDEHRLSNSIRSADWLLTGVNNQSSPSTFYTMGNETLNISISDTSVITESKNLSITTPLISVSDSSTITDAISISLPGISTNPDITIRQAISPYNVLSSLNYFQSKIGSSALPVLQGEQSVPQLFRIYNNFALNSGIKDALNVNITVYDSASVLTASMPAASQSWLHVMEDGYGQSTTVSFDHLTKYTGQDTPVGGSNMYMPEIGSNGIVGTPTIAALGNIAGYIQLKSYLTPADNAVGDTYNFAIVIIYEYS